MNNEEKTEEQSTEMSDNESEPLPINPLTKQATGQPITDNGKYTIIRMLKRKISKNIF